MKVCICQRSGRNSYFIRMPCGDVGIGTRPTAKTMAQKFDYATSQLVDAVKDVYRSTSGGQRPQFESVVRIRSFPKVEAKLIAAGLIEPETTQHSSLKWLTDEVTALRTPPAKYRSAGSKLCRYFGEGRDVKVDPISKAEARKFKRWLEIEGGDKGKPLANATVVRLVKACVTIFNHAIDADLITKNPFRKIVDSGTGSMSNRDAHTMVTREMIAKVIDACGKDRELIRLIGLTRYGGMRIEVEAMQVDSSMIQDDCISIVGKGGKARDVPLFPTLLPFLDFEGPILKSGRTVNELRDLLKAAIVKAGYTPWAKPWHDLKRSRVTELWNQGASIDDISEWVGTSPQVLREHYKIGDREAVARGNALPDALPSGILWDHMGSQNQQKTPQSDTMCLDVTLSMTPTGLEPVLPP